MDERKEKEKNVVSILFLFKIEMFSLFLFNCIQYQYLETVNRIHVLLLKDNSN